MGKIDPDEDAIQRLKALWGERLRAAERNLKLAQDSLEAVIENLRPGDLKVAEGLSPYRKASEAEVQALREYERVLRIVSDLDIYGKIPDEEAH